MGDEPNTPARPPTSSSQNEQPIVEEVGTPPQSYHNFQGFTNSPFLGVAVQQPFVMPQQTAIISALAMQEAMQSAFRSMQPRSLMPLDEGHAAWNTTVSGEKRKPGRPRTKKGSAKKTKKEESDEEWSEDNPSTSSFNLRPRAGVKLPSTPAAAPASTEPPAGVVACPPRCPDDVNVAHDSNAACSNCSFWVGRYVVEPCFHYSFCVTCLESEHLSATTAKRDPQCMACHVRVLRYRCGHRATILNLPRYNPDTDE